MRIGFQAGAINERGMSVALYDYALGAQNILGHEAFVFYSEKGSNPAVVEKFRKSLNLVQVIWICLERKMEKKRIMN